jgi:hypothetical protein
MVSVYINYDSECCFVLCAFEPVAEASSAFYLALQIYFSTRGEIFRHTKINLRNFVHFATALTLIGVQTCQSINYSSNFVTKT